MPGDEGVFPFEDLSDETRKWLVELRIRKMKGELNLDCPD